MIVYLSRDNKINNHKFTEYFLFAEVIALANNKEQLFYHFSIKNTRTVVRIWLMT